MYKNNYYKKENEAAVNRFLLSTLFLILFEFGLYLLNITGSNFSLIARCPNVLHIINWTLIIFGAVGMLLMITLMLLKKIKLSTAVYFLVVFFSICLVGIFHEYYYVFLGYNTMFNAVSTRLKAFAILFLLVYLYEVVRYFLNVNKV